MLTHRLAAREDIAAMSALMEAAIAELLKPFLDAAQIAASRTIMGLDSQLIDDKTYFVVEDGNALAGRLDAPVARPYLPPRSEHGTRVGRARAERS